MCRSEDKEPMESETNSVDRTIANLMFNKMDINVRDLTTFNSEQVFENKGLQGKTSRALNQAQNFNYPNALNLQGDIGVPRFNQSNQETAAESHIMYRDPAEKSLMLEFG